METDFTKKLLKWYKEANNRPMPWKGERDPYRIWLSEIILQQTRVEQGWNYYIKFIDNYPDVAALAAAPEQDVFKLWEGLGYYSRCRNLLSAARYIAKELNGEFPKDYDGILSLKGIGPYTAAAISSFAYDLPYAVVDGNVQRVLARYFGDETPIDSVAGKKVFRQLANSLLDKKSPSPYNQAIMDFGATVCRPRNPLCSNCVYRSECVAFNTSRVNDLPVKEKKLKRRARWMYYFILRHEKSVYIRKRMESDIWQDLHEFVLCESHQELTDPVSGFLPSILKHGDYELEYSSGIITQHLTHQKIQGRFYVVNLRTPASLLQEYTLVNRGNLNGYAFPRFINSFLESYPV